MNELNVELKQEFFSKYTEKLELKEKNYLRIFNEVGNSFAYNLLENKGDILYHLISEEGEFVVCDGKISSMLATTNFPIFLDKPSPFVEKIKASMDYHSNMFKSYFVSNNIEKMIHHYTNFFAAYVVFIEVRNQFERKLEKGDVKQDFLRAFSPSYYYSFYKDPFFSKYFNEELPCFDGKQIIKMRKRELMKNESSYYLFRLIDFSVDYLDSYYLFSKLMLESLKRRKLSKNKFLSLIKKAFFEKPVISLAASFLNYENLNYFNSKTKGNE